MEEKESIILASAVSKHQAIKAFDYDAFMQDFASPLIGTSGKLFQFLPNFIYSKSESGINYSFSPAGLIRNVLALEASESGQFPEYLQHDRGFSEKKKDEELLRSLFSKNEIFEMFNSESLFCLWGWARENFNVKKITYPKTYFKESPVIIVPGYTNCDNPTKRRLNLQKLLEIEETNTNYSTRSLWRDGVISGIKYMNAQRNIDGKIHSLSGIAHRGRAAQEIR